jgi:uncharacterized protein (TIRG00374 family)
LLPNRRARRFAVRLNAIPKVGHSAAEFWRAIVMYRNQWRSVLAALLISLVGHCGFVLTYYFAAMAFLGTSLEQIPSLAEHFLIVPVGMAGQGFIPTPGGVGGGELVFDGLYLMLGMPKGNGALMCFVYRVITWILSFLGYLLYLGMRPEAGAVPKATVSEHGTDSVGPVVGDLPAALGTARAQVTEP